MKEKFLMVLLLVLPEILFGQEISGSFRLIEGQYGDGPMEKMIGIQAVKLFKDGYWLTCFFGKQGEHHSGSGGGTFQVKGAKYIETLWFYSWDSTASKQTYVFDYTLKDDVYFQEGYINSDQYKNYLIREHTSRVKTKIPLVNASLEGAWLQTGDKSPDVIGLKIFAYPSFQCSYFNEKTKEFLGTYGGRYWYDGKDLVEHIDFTTFGGAIGMEREIPLKLKGSSFRQPRIDSDKSEQWLKSKK